MIPAASMEVWHFLPTLLTGSGALAWLLAAVCSWLVAPRAGILPEGGKSWNGYWFAFGGACILVSVCAFIKVSGDSIALVIGDRVPAGFPAATAGVAVAVFIGVLARPKLIASERRWLVMRNSIVAAGLAIGFLFPASVPALLVAAGVLVGIPVVARPDFWQGDAGTRERARATRIVGVAVVTVGLAWGGEDLIRHAGAGLQDIGRLMLGLLTAVGGWYVFVAVWGEYLQRFISSRVRSLPAVLGVTPRWALPLLVACFCLAGLPLAELAYRKAMSYVAERAVSEVAAMSMAFRWNRTASFAEAGEFDETRLAIAERILRMLTTQNDHYLAAAVWMRTEADPITLAVYGFSEKGEPVDSTRLLQPVLRARQVRPFAWSGDAFRYRTATVTVPAPEARPLHSEWYFTVLMDGRGIVMPVIVQVFESHGLVIMSLLLLVGSGMLWVWSLNESELRARKEQAEAEARARERLVGVVSHELRTPLQSILGFAELLSEEALPPMVARQVRAIRSQGGLLLRMVQDILDFTALQSGRVTLINDIVVLEELCDDLRAAFSGRAASRGIEFRVTAAEDLPFAVVTDRLRISQVLLNLVGNAVKLTREGFVHVDISWRPLSTDGAQPRIELVLAVSDSGPGLSASQARRAFEPFRKLHTDETTAGGGVGLGLAICRQIVERLGGEISLTSHVGEGSVFTVRLPVSVAALTAGEIAEATETRSPAGQAQPLAGLRILVVDDNPYVRELMREFIHRAGAAVHARPDGRSAMQVACETEFDVILLDVRLPDVDGRVVATTIRERWGQPDHPWIVGLSAGLAESEVDALFKNGFNDFLLKPVSMNGLAETIRLSPAGGRIVPARIEEQSLPEPGAEARQAFFNEAQAVLSRIEGMAREGGGPQIVAEAHYLANGCITFGLEEAFRLCREIEELGESPEFDAVLEQTARLGGVLEIASRPAKA